MWYALVPDRIAAITTHCPPIMSHIISGVFDYNKMSLFSYAISYGTIDSKIGRQVQENKNQPHPGLNVHCTC